MKLLLLSGSHSRHLFVHQRILDEFDVCGAVLMVREDEIPAPPPSIQEQDKSNWIRHFGDRHQVETAAFGRQSPEDIFQNTPLMKVTSSQLNSAETTQFIDRLDADIAIIFGTDLIRDPLFTALPKEKINLHLGLSPWYRGSATLFWPFYDLRPQYAGATFHYIIPEADAGNIIHQSIPDLTAGDGIHDVAANTVKSATSDLVKLLHMRNSGGEFQDKRQRSSGRLFLSNDFKPEHLRVIYELYDNDITDQFLQGKLSSPRPRLISAFQ